MNKIIRRFVVLLGINITVEDTDRTAERVKLAHHYARLRALRRQVDIMLRDRGRV